MKVELRELTTETLEAALQLQVYARQRRYIDTNAEALAKMFGDPRARGFGIHAGDDLVGIAILYGKRGDPVPWLMHFMVDHRYQDKGYGKAALQAVIREARRLGGKRLALGYVCGPDSPAPFYEELGFRQVSGEMERRL